MLAIIAMLVVPTMAQNPHFVQTVKFYDMGTESRAIGSVGGLGNENIDVLMDATGDASITCRNNGGQEVPGQATSVDVFGATYNIEVKNGKANFVVQTNQPPTVDPNDVCPNNLWQAIVTDVKFNSATITVIQPSGSDIVAVKETFVP